MLKEKVRYGGQIFFIPLNNIVPNANQPRKIFNKDELESLAQSIKHNGILQPISVHRTASVNVYEIISGERRYRAARLAGLTAVPCIVLEAQAERLAVLALIENIQREDLSFLEEARAINETMTTFGFSQEEMAAKLGMAQSTLCNKLRILKLPPDVCMDIERYKLTQRHARALLRLPNDEQMRKALSQMLEKHMNVTQAENLVERMLNPKKERKAPILIFNDLKIFVNSLNFAVEKMNSAGINAKAVKQENEDYVEYTVVIPKRVGEPAHNFLHSKKVM